KGAASRVATAGSGAEGTARPGIARAACSAARGGRRGAESATGTYKSDDENGKQSTHTASYRASTCFWNDPAHIDRNARRGWSPRHRNCATMLSSAARLDMIFDT